MKDPSRETSSLKVELLGLLPRVGRVTEVTVSSGLKVLRLLEVEGLDNKSGSEVEVLPDNFDELSIALLAGTVSVDEDGKRFSDTDGVRELDEGSSGETSSDKGLGDPSGSVGGGSVDLGPVLTGEGTTTVGTPTTVGVDNDLSTSETGVTLRTTNDKSAGRLDVVDDSVIKKVLGDNLLDDLLEDLLSELFGSDLLSVLGGNDDSVDTEGDHGTVLTLLVLNGNLSLRVGSEPAQRTVTTGSGHSGVKLVGEHDGKGHHFGGFVGSVTEHDTLVTSTDLLEGTVVKTLSNVGRLLLNGNQDVTGLVVETLVGRVVTDLLDGVSDNLLVVDLSPGGDLTEDHDHTGLSGGLASDLGERVLSETGVEDGIRDLVTDLVGMALTNGLGGEKEVAGGQLSHGTVTVNTDSSHFIYK